MLEAEGQKIPRHALLDSAITAIQKSHEIFKQIGNKRGIAFSLVGIGHIWGLKNRPMEALSYYKQAYTLADSIGALSLQKEAAHGLYQTYQKLGQSANALHWHEQYTIHKDSLFNKEKQKKLGQLETRYKWQKKVLQ